MCVNNPYEFLGLNRGATEQDVMNAYRRIAGEIQNAGYPEQEMQRRMDELNLAYDTILGEMRGTASYTNNNYSNTQQSSSYNYGYNYNNNQNQSASQFSDVRQRINAGRIDDAETILDGIPTNMRNAEWNYLKGVIHQRRGWLNEAYRCYQTACRLDPSNQEYAAAFNALNNNARGGYRTSRKTSNDGVCDLCTGLLCADCCCECCGGDLIPCC